MLVLAPSQRLQSADVRACKSQIPHESVIYVSRHTVGSVIGRAILPCSRKQQPSACTALCSAAVLASFCQAKAYCYVTSVHAWQVYCRAACVTGHDNNMRLANLYTVGSVAPVSMLDGSKCNDNAQAPAVGLLHKSNSTFLVVPGSRPAA